MAKTHGLRYTREYRIWQGMLARCYTRSATGYGNYGAKGVRVCRRWRQSFAAFIGDVGLAPTEQHSLDRFPNKAGNYEPGNVRWATDTEQNRNSQHNRMLTFSGRTMCLSAWAAEVGISKKVVQDRIGKLRWEVERALTTPVLSNRRPKVHR